MVASFLGGFIIAFLKGWLLTFAMLLCIPPLVISGAVMTMLVSKMASHGQTAYSLAATVVEQTVGSIRTVSSFTGEKQAIAKYTKSLTKAYKSGVQEELAAGLGFGALMFILFCCYAFAIWFGTKMILDKGYTGGDVISVIFAVLSGSLQLGQASPCITAFAAGQAAAFKRKYICMLTSAGFWSAMASNVTNQSRNVLRKKFMVKKEESLDNITLFSIITIKVYTRSFLAALCFHAYQQLSPWVWSQRLLVYQRRETSNTKMRTESTSISSPIKRGLQELEGSYVLMSLTK